MQGFDREAAEIEAGRRIDLKPAPAVHCQYCGQRATLTTGSVIYPKKPRLASLNFWRCVPCDAWIGTFGNDCRGAGHPNTPLGTLANRSLRNARSQARMAFEALWRQSRMPPQKAKEWLAAKLGMPVSYSLISNLDEAECERAVVACSEYQAEAQGGQPCRQALAGKEPK